MSIRVTCVSTAGRYMDRQRIPFLLCICLVCSLWTTTCHGFIYSMTSLPELVSTAPVIVSGEISVRNNVTRLTVRTVLKGAVSRRSLTIETGWAGGQRWIVSGRPLSEPRLRFTDGEKVILFLEQPGSDGTAIPFGGGDSGKWPRQPGSSGVYPLLSSASLDDVVELVRGVRRIKERPSKEERLSSLSEWIRSPDQRKQLVAIDYICEGFWAQPEKKPGDLSTITQEERIAVATRFMDDIHRLLQSDKTEIRGHSLFLLRYTKYDLAKPALVKASSDTDVWVRRVVRDVLNGLLFEEIRPPELQAEDRKRPFPFTKTYTLHSDSGETLLCTFTFMNSVYRYWEFSDPKLLEESRKNTRAPVSKEYVFTGQGDKEGNKYRVTLTYSMGLERPSHYTERDTDFKDGSAAYSLNAGDDGFIQAIIRK